MPRQPDIQNKTNRLVYIPQSLDENKLSMDVKTLCIQDGITIRDFLSEAISLAFKVHHWPPGNPQLTLANYQVKPLSLGVCGYSGCKCKAVGKGEYLPRKKMYALCEAHTRLAANSSKIWRLN